MTIAEYVRREAELSSSGLSEKALQEVIQSLEKEQKEKREAEAKKSFETEKKEITSWMKLNPMSTTSRDCSLTRSCSPKSI